MNADREMIERRIHDLVSAYNRGDIDAVMSVFAADLVDMSAGEATLRGAQAHRQTSDRLRDTFTKFKGHLTVTSEEIEVAGDWAFDWGTLQVRLDPLEGGQPKIIERRFLEIWRRSKTGGWQVVRGMENSEQRGDELSLDFRTSAGATTLFDN